MRRIATLGLAVLKAAVFGSLAIMGAQVSWHSMGEDAIVVPPPPKTTYAPEAPLLPETQAILDAAPFGRAPSAVPAAPEASEVPQMALRGVLYDGGGGSSLAFLAVDGDTGSFPRGAEVAPGATLAEIGPDSVVIAFGERRITLAFGGAVAEEAPAEAEAGSAFGVGRLAALVTTPETPRYATVETGPDAPRTMQEHIDLWRARIDRNPLRVLEHIGLIPTPRGYRIAQDHDSGVALAGLRPGDLVTAVNGFPVGDVETDRDNLDAIEAAGQARLEIEREGGIIVLTFPLR